MGAYFESEIECNTCLEKALTSMKSEDFLLLALKTYLDCHESSMGYTMPKPGAPLIVHFPHKLHTKEGLTSVLTRRPVTS